MRRIIFSFVVKDREDSEQFVYGKVDLVKVTVSAYLAAERSQLCRSKQVPKKFIKDFSVVD